jgi:hypothetical protein
VAFEMFEPFTEPRSVKLNLMWLFDPEQTISAMLLP